MSKKINWNEVDKEFENDIQKIKNAQKDIKEYRKKKTSARQDAELTNKALQK